MSVTDIVPDLDFSELDDEGATPAAEGPVTGSRSRGRGTSSATSSSSGTTSTPRRRGFTTKRLDALKSKLSGQMYTAGVLVGVPLPVTGIYTCQESARFSSAVVDLAASRPEWIEALEKLALLEPGLIVGRTAMGIGCALAVDRGRAKPDGRVAMFLGVTEAWMRLQEEDGDEGASYSPPPSKFEPV